MAEQVRNRPQRPGFGDHGCGAGGGWQDNSPNAGSARLVIESTAGLSQAQQARPARMARASGAQQRL